MHASKNPKQSQHQEDNIYKVNNHIQTFQKVANKKEDKGEKEDEDQNNTWQLYSLTRRDQQVGRRKGVHRNLHNNDNNKENNKGKNIEEKAEVWNTKLQNMNNNSKIHMSRYKYNNQLYNIYLIGCNYVEVRRKEKSTWEIGECSHNQDNNKAESQMCGMN